MRYQIRHAIVKYAADLILEDVNFEIHDTEKIAVIGRNGCGKTTLLKLITGEIEMSNLDSDEECGITRAGEQRIGYLRQISFEDSNITAENEILKVFEPIFVCEQRMHEISELLQVQSDSKLLSEYAKLQSQMEALRGYSYRKDMETMFQKFGFRLDDLHKPMGTFSGGQQTKIAFIKLLLSRPDIMLLDEPTNHMDLVGKEALEKMLKVYTGTILFVSHDRYFIREVATGILNFEANQVKYYPVGYDEFLEKKGEVSRANDIKHEKTQKNEKQNLADKESKKQEPTLSDVFDKKTYYNPGKILSRLKQQLTKYEKMLQESEDRLAELQLQQMNPEIASNYEKLTELSLAIEQEERTQESILERMMETEDELFQLQNES